MAANSIAADGFVYASLAELMALEGQQHNDVIAIQIYDPIALQLPDKGRLNVTQGAQQVELEVGQRRINRPLGAFLAGRLRDVAELLRRSQVPLLLVSSGDDSLEQLRRELGRLAQAPR